MAFLGDTLEQIAHEKAGIIKLNIPVVIGEALPETIPVFEMKVIKEDAPIFYAEEFIKVTFKRYENNSMIVETSDNKTYQVGLCGNYQLKNIATTLTAIDQLNELDYKISNSSIKRGFEKVIEITGFRGRWQVLQQAPAVVADTGHNVGGFRYIVEQLKAQNYKTLRIIIGMVNDKDISAVLALLPADALYYFTQASIVRALPAEELQKQAKSLGLTGEAYPSVKEAIRAALEEADQADFIFIGGSNFVVGEALPNF